MSKKTSSALDIIERQIKPLLPNKFCIAFSGGMDSTVLLHVMKNIIDEKSQIRAIHINHNIVDNSKVWTKTCKSICKNFGIDIEIISLEVTHNGYGLEAAARDERYKKQLRKVNTHINVLHRHYLKNHYDELATDNESFIWYLCLNDLL